MSNSHEHDAAAQKTGPSGDDEHGDSGTGGSGATDRFSEGPSRDGEVGSGGGGNPPATDPPSRGGD
jgi:hypothetical protein